MILPIEKFSSFVLSNVTTRYPISALLFVKWFLTGGYKNKRKFKTLSSEHGRGH